LSFDVTDYDENLLIDLKTIGDIDPVVDGSPRRLTPSGVSTEAPTHPPMHPELGVASAAGGPVRADQGKVLGIATAT
jgi:hypothetical protein